MIGALVLLRNFGPPFEPVEISLCNFLADQITHLISREQLLEEINRLQTKLTISTVQDDFIALISHESLTPLGFIKGYTTTLLRDDITWDTDTQREFLGIIEEEADRLRSLTKTCWILPTFKLEIYGWRYSR